MSEEMVARYEANGFKRWTKGSMDRLYIDVTKLGLELEYYKTGNISQAHWCGSSISNANGYRFKDSKVYVDVATGELHVQDLTRIDWHYYDLPTLEDKARELVAEIAEQ